METIEIIKSIVDIIVNNGIGVACVIYMIYFQLTTMKDMNTTLTTMTTTLQGINERLKDVEEKIDKK